MTTTQTPPTVPATGTTPSAKEQFLDAYEREHATTMRVLRAYPEDKLELKPSEKSKSAKELAWIFVLERGLGKLVMEDAFAKGTAGGGTPPVPDSWQEILDTFEQAHRDFGNYVRAMPEAQLNETVKFFTAPKTMGDVTRLGFLWFLLHDEIHHRGQFSVYLRIAGAKVPSIYGPTADEPWM